MSESQSDELRKRLSSSWTCRVRYSSASLFDMILTPSITSFIQTTPLVTGDPHEMILYALNFFMILQSVKVWQNWRHSPVAGAIRKWQSTRLNKMLRQRELRRIQRRAARELAKQSAPSGAAFATPSTARGLITRGGGFGSKVLSGMENVIFSILRVALSALGSIFMS